MEKESNEGYKTDKQLDWVMAQSTKCLQYQHGQLHGYDGVDDMI